MSKMKDYMIDQMNLDWEAMHEREQAMIDAERQYNEEMLWLELQKEEEYIKELEQAKIITDDRHKETKEVVGDGSGHECSDAPDLRNGQSGHEEPARISSDREADESTREERIHSDGEGHQL